MRTVPVLDLFCHGCETGRPVTVAEDETMTCLRCAQPIRCGQCTRPATVDHLVDEHPEGFDAQLVVSRFLCDRSGWSNTLPSGRVQADPRIPCEDTDPHGRHMGSVSVTERGGTASFRAVWCPGYEAVDTRQIERALRRGGMPPATRGLLRWGPVGEGLIVSQENWTTRVEFDYPDQPARQLTTLLLAARVLTGSGFRVFRETKVQPGLLERLRVGRTQQF